MVDTATARTRLQDVLTEVDKETAVLQGEHAGESVDLSHQTNHPADVATEISEVEREDALLANLAARRERVVQALGRVEDGTYGTCLACGTAIPEERLALIPEAEYSVDCQAQQEERR